MKLAEWVALLGYDEDEVEPRPSVAWLLIELFGIGFLLVVLVLYLAGVA